MVSRAWHRVARFVWKSEDLKRIVECRNILTGHRQALLTIHVIYQKTNIIIYIIILNIKCKDRPLDRHQIQGFTRTIYNKVTLRNQMLIDTIVR